MTLTTIYTYNSKMNDFNTDRQVFSISELNRRVRQLLELNLPMLWVEGEISNFSCPVSGHWYLSLKDKSAQVRCAMFRNANQRVKFRPGNGMQVLVRCKPGLYEGRGEYQLIVEHMEEAGFGALQRQFEQLKAKLSAEGLFDNDNKRPIPSSVTHIGVVTSTTGAAVKDIITVLKRRFPAIRVSLFPTAVQGDEAPAQITKALSDANSCEDLDAIIIGRGGGSLEDLWSFNNEMVARAIAASRLPTISAVGHEVDFTIADFVADLRAPTPSAAAELISPDGQQMIGQFARYQMLLKDIQQRIIGGYQQQLSHLQKRLQHPGNKLQQQSQLLDHLDIRLRRAIESKLDSYRVQCKQLSDQLGRQNPQYQLQENQQKLSALVKQLARAINQKQEKLQLKLAQSMHLLDTVSPLKTLGRGYAVIRNADGEVVNSVAKAETDDCLTGQFADGELLLKVTAKNNKTLS